MVSIMVLGVASLWVRFPFALSMEEQVWKGNPLEPKPELQILTFILAKPPGKNFKNTVRSQVFCFVLFSRGKDLRFVKLLIIYLLYYR